MFVIRGDDGAPVAFERYRRRIRSRAPLLVEKVHRLLRLAELGSRGPDPEAAMAHLEAARRALAAFLKVTHTE